MCASRWNWCICPSSQASGQACLISMVSSCFCYFHRNHFFCLYKQSKFSEPKLKLRQASNCHKRVLEAAKHLYANKTKQSITSQKCGSWNFWWIANSGLSKGKYAISPLINGHEMLSSAKVNSFAENLSMNSNLDDSGIFLPVFPSRTNPKLHNTS